MAAKGVASAERSSDAGGSFEVELEADEGGCRCSEDFCSGPLASRLEGVRS